MTLTPLLAAPTVIQIHAFAALAAFALGPVHLGPGLRIRRGGAHDDSLTALYELVMWDTLTVYAKVRLFANCRAERDVLGGCYP